MGATTGLAIQGMCKTSCGLPCEGGDNDTAAIEWAAAGGYDISGCGDLQPYCENADTGSAIQGMCKTTCGSPAKSQPKSKPKSQPKTFADLGWRLHPESGTHP